MISIRNFFKKNSKLADKRLVVGRLGNGIALVSIDHVSQAKPCVKHCGINQFVEEGNEGFADLCKKAGFSGYSCTYLLSPGEYSMLQIEKPKLLSSGEYSMSQMDRPKVPAVELKEAIRWQVRDFLNYPVEEATIDTLEIPYKSEMQHAASMYVIAAPNETIRKHMKFANGAGLQLDVIDIPEMAQRNLATLFEQPDRVLMLLSFGFDSDDCLLTFTANGELYLARRIDLSLSQILNADEVQRNQYLERLTLELQRSIDHFDRKHHSMSLSCFMLTPFSGVDMLQQYLNANLDLTVSVMNLDDVLDFSDVPDLVGDIEGHGRFFFFLGAALR